MKINEDVRFMASVATFIVGFVGLHMGWHYVQQFNVPIEQRHPHPFQRLYQRLQKPVEK